jgi:hypothetical protein
MKTLDTRDLYARKCELESLRDDVQTAKDELEEASKAVNDYDPGYMNAERDKEFQELTEAMEAAETALTDAESAFDESEQDELKELEELENEMDSRSFRDGVQLIPEYDFEEYAREEASSLYGRGMDDAHWPFTCIDWERAANELQQDYSAVTYQGTDYLFRE